MLSARATTSVVLVLLALLAGAPDASAVTRDARQACGVTSEDPAGRTAAVPADKQEVFFLYVPSSVDPAPLLCGNGVKTGAVHIELKHKVPNWGDAVTAIVNTIDHGRPELDRTEEGRTRYVWTYAPGKTMVVVVGGYSIVTAYPLDDREESWIEASTAA